MYEHLVYDDFKFSTPAQVEPRLYDRTLTMNGVSKAYCMTGWRIGYAAGPKPLINAMANIQSQSTSNPCSISQKAAVAALKLGGPFTEKMVVEFDRRRKVMVERLNAIPGVSCRMPGGAFYAFPNISGGRAQKEQNGPITSPQELANYLLKEAHVAVVPGEPFGSRQHVRLSYATGMDTITKGLDRIAAAFGKLSA